MGTRFGSVAAALASAPPGLLLDENMPPGFARALREVGYAAVSVHEVLPGADDKEVLRFCADKHLAWITQDAGARVKASYLDLIAKHRVSIVFLRPPKRHGWDPKAMFSVLARDMPAIEEAVAEERPCYWVCKDRQRARRLKTVTEKF